MSTVASRTFVSTPQRDAHRTWEAVVDLLTQGQPDGPREELDAVGGIAASVIADRTPAESPIVVTCDGPRTRIYCIYDDDAVDGSDANEDALGFDPLNGDWHVSLPCTADDLDWVQVALKEHSERITGRTAGEPVTKNDQASEETAGLTLNPDEFLKS